MSARHLSQAMDVGRKILLSLGAGWLLLGGFRGLPNFPTESPPSSPADRSHGDPNGTRDWGDAPVRQARPSPLVIDGIPMITETFIESPCDAESWKPEHSPLWKEGALLLFSEHGDREATAAWIESRNSGEGLSTVRASVEKGVFHGVQLRCDGPSSGLLTHSYTTAPLDAEAWRNPLDNPVRERSGPVPLLEDAVQLTAVRNLDWTLFIDRPTDPYTAVDRLHRAMAGRGFTAKTPTRERLAGAGLDLPTGSLSGIKGGVWVRGGVLCLAALEPEGGVGPASDLLVIACRGNLFQLGGAR